MNTEQKSLFEEGPLVWVESLLTSKEWEEMRKKYKTYTKKSKPPQYISEEYKGGKWRAEK